MVRVPKGIWWIPATGWVWLTTTKGFVGDWARDLSWKAIKWGGRSVVAGAVYTARSTWSRLLIPAAIWSAPVTVPLAVGAGVLATATVIAGVHTAALQQTGMVGPSAPKTSDPSWFGGLEMNPYMFSMGTVV